MTISTPRTKSGLETGSPFGGGEPAQPAAATQRNRAFTLMEAMIATALSTIVLAGVLSAFLMIGRTSVTSSNYSQNAAETRRALELFGQDARLASNIRWTNDHHITLTIPQTGAATVLVTYAYDDQPASETHRCFYRIVESNGHTAPRQILAREVSELSFQRFKLEQTGVPANIASNDLETKQVQLTLRATRRGSITPVASQTALSASYILRNKRVSN
jgi:type II secretory pathway component PulJ